MAAKVILFLIRLAVGGLFIYAGVLKAMDPALFAQEISNYHLIPWPDAVVLLAIYLPWFEILSGAAVAFRRWYLGGLAALGIMLIVFTGALSYAWARGLDISCGCFGREAKNVKANFPLLVGRDIAMLAGVAVLLVVERRRLASSSIKP